MNKPRKDRPLYQRIAIDVAGFGLMIIAPFLGWLPGPGGIPLFIAGLGLVALNHEWAANLLRDFEEKRQELTDKYLMTSPRVSLTVDALSVVLFGVGLYIAVSQDALILRGAGLGLASITLIITLSNQKRFERIAAWFKKTRHKR